MPEGPGVNALCPRCGAGFHCGAQEGSCDCAGLALDGATRDALRLRFEGCLCVACLRVLLAERDAVAASGERVR